MNDPKKLLQFFRKNIAAFILAILVFILLYIYIAETGRRKMLINELKIVKRDRIRLEKEVIQTKKDFFDLSKQIKENDSLFYNRDFDLYMDVNTIINRMSNRFESDGLSTFPTD
jgi:hypothetical protein